MRISDWSSDVCSSDLPSASFNASNQGLYEPSHGSAPDIAGKNIANPLATILSAAMLLRYSLDQNAQAARIEAAVQSVLEQGLRTADIYESGTTKVSTSEMGEDRKSTRLNSSH